MIKEVFNLKKNAWHSKLMKFTWGYTHYDFSHICPYFWLTILNVLLSPVTFLLKFVLWRSCKQVGKFFMWAVINPMHTVASKIPDKYDRRIKFQNTLLDNLKNGKGLEDFMKIDLYKDCNYKYVAVYNQLRNDKTYAEIFAKLKEMRTAYEKAEYERKQKYNEELKAITIKNKQRITRMVGIFKPIATFVLYLAAGFSLVFLGFGLYELILLIYFMVVGIAHWIMNMQFGTSSWSIVFTIIGGSCALTLGILGILLMEIRYQECCECQERVRKFFSWFKWLGYPFIYIGKFFKICYTILKNNCPAINWED